jgi:hypothetical protein
VNVLGFLVAQLTSANAAQYSVVSFIICHIHSPFFVISFTLPGVSGGSESRFGGGADQVFISRQQLPG